MNDRRQALCHEKQEYTYDEMADKYDVNKFYLWMIVNYPKYRLPRKIKRKLGFISPSPRRIAIHCDNMISAARSIKNNLDKKKIQELIEILEK